jgi:uncharacterized protein YggT (Ycf19 family)
MPFISPDTLSWYTKCVKTRFSIDNEEAERFRLWICEPILQPVRLFLLHLGLFHGKCVVFTASLRFRSCEAEKEEDPP